MNTRKEKNIIRKNLHSEKTVGCLETLRGIFSLNRFFFFQLFLKLQHRGEMVFGLRVLSFFLFSFPPSMWRSIHPGPDQSKQNLISFFLFFLLKKKNKLKRLFPPLLSVFSFPPLKKLNSNHRVSRGRTKRERQMMSRCLVSGMICYQQFSTGKLVIASRSYWISLSRQRRREGQ